MAILSVKNGMDALKTNKNGMEALKTNKNGMEALKTGPTPLQLLIKDMPGKNLSSFPDPILYAIYIILVHKLPLELSFNLDRIRIFYDYTEACYVKVWLSVYSII